MILTIKDLKEAIDDIPEDNIIYVKTVDGDLFDISRINDATSVGFWEIRLSNTCTAYSESDENQQKHYNPEYIERCDKQIWKILNDTKEWDDWTQFCLSVQNAVQSAANIWGIGTPEQKVQMGKFINELVIGCVLKNLSEFDINFGRKEIIP